MIRLYPPTAPIDTTHSRNRTSSPDQHFDPVDPEIQEEGVPCPSLGLRLSSAEVDATGWVLSECSMVE